MMRHIRCAGAALVLVLAIPCYPALATGGEAIDLLGQTSDEVGVAVAAAAQQTDHPVYDLRPEPFSEEDVLFISLEDILALAINNNLGLQQQEYTIEKGHYSVDRTYYAYDPMISASAGVNWSESDSTGSTVRSMSYSTSLGATLPREYGDRFQVSLDHGANDTDVLPATYSSSVSVSYMRPLGQGAGKYYNRIGRYISSNNLLLSYDRLDNEVRNLKARVLDLYYQAVSARETIDVRETGLDLALGQLERSVERYKVGLAIRVEVLQSENSVLNQKASLLASRKNYAETLDALAVLTGIPQELELAVDADTALPDYSGELPTDLWDLVLTNSFELKSLQTQLANLKLTRDQQLHSLKPDLDLGVSYSRGESHDNPISALGSADSQSMGINLSWNTTPGKRSARADLAQTEIDLASLDLSIQDVELQLKAGLRAQQRNLTTLRQQIDIAHGNVEVSKEAYAIQQERNEVGLATALDVIEAQENLLLSELALLTARVAYQQAYRDVLLSAGLI